MPRVESPLIIIHYGLLNEGIIQQPQVTPCQFVNDIIDHSDCRKPHGRNLIWGSPMESEFGWEEFSRTNAMTEELKQPKWQINLELSAKIAKIHTRSEANIFKRMYPNKYGSILDWPKIASDYQAFWVTSKGQANSLFNGWDCETVIIFSVDIIQKIENIS